MNELTSAVNSTLDLSAARIRPPEVDPFEGWSEAEMKWVNALPPIYRNIAGRHGRLMYQYVVFAGVLNDGIAQSMRFLKGNRSGTEGMGFIHQASQWAFDQIKGDLLAAGKTDKDILACKLDIERAVALMNASTAGMPRE